GRRRSCRRPRSMMIRMWWPRCRAAWVRRWWASTWTTSRRNSTTPPAAGSSGPWRQEFRIVPNSLLKGARWDGLVSVSDLNSRGRRLFGDLIPGGESCLDAIFRASPSLGELAVGVVYGHLHARPALDPTMPEAVAIAAIAAAGMVDVPLRVHTRSALAAGLSAGEITEVLLEVAAFGGFPRAVQALQTVAEVLEEGPDRDRRFGRGHQEHARQSLLGHQVGRARPGRERPAPGGQGWRRRHSCRPGSREHPFLGGARRTP